MAGLPGHRPHHRQHRGRDDALAPQHIGDRAGEGRGERDGERARRHDRADAGGVGAELPRERRQQRLGGVQIEKGAEAGNRNGDGAVVEEHVAVLEHDQEGGEPAFRKACRALDPRDHARSRERRSKDRAAAVAGIVGVRCCPCAARSRGQLPHVAEVAGRNGQRGGHIRQRLRPIDQGESAERNSRHRGPGFQQPQLFAAQVVPKTSGRQERDAHSGLGQGHRDRQALAAIQSLGDDAARLKPPVDRLVVK